MATKHKKPSPLGPPAGGEHMLALGEILAEYPEQNSNYARAKQNANVQPDPYKKAFRVGLLAGLLVGAAIIVSLLIVGR